MENNKRIIAANFKMNLTKTEVEQYLGEIEGKIEKNRVIFFPTSLYASLFLEKGYRVGIQNVYQEEEGSYTGEISPKQAFSTGISYVLLGHSERRYIFHETEKEIGEKVRVSLKNGLKVILCIGETEKEREEGRTLESIGRLLKASLQNIPSLENIIIAYEPIWSIGTGRIPSREEIEEILDYIRKNIRDLGYFEAVPLLYGGSIDTNTIQYLKGIKGIDGFLFGRASLKPEILLQMIEVAVTM